MLESHFADKETEVLGSKMAYLDYRDGERILTQSLYLQNS